MYSSYQHYTSIEVLVYLSLLSLPFPIQEQCDFLKDPIIFGEIADLLFLKISVSSGVRWMCTFIQWPQLWVISPPGPTPWNRDASSSFPLDICVPFLSTAKQILNVPTEMTYLGVNNIQQHFQ